MCVYAHQLCSYTSSRGYAASTSPATQSCIVHVRRCAMLSLYNAAAILMDTLLRNAQVYVCSNMPCSARPARHCNSTAAERSIGVAAGTHEKLAAPLPLSSHEKCAAVPQPCNSSAQRATTHNLQRTSTSKQQALQRRSIYVAAPPTLHCGCAAHECTHSAHCA